MANDSSAHKIMRVVHQIEDLAAGSVLLLLVVFSFSQLILKSLFAEFDLWGHHFTIPPLKWFLDAFGHGFSWGDSFQRQIVLWLAILGAMTATRQDRHINVEIGSKFLPIKWKTSIRIITDAFTAAICGLVSYTGVVLVSNEIGTGTMAFASVPSWVMESIIPFGFGIISLRYVRYFMLHVLQATGYLPLPTEDKTPPPVGVI